MEATLGPSLTTEFANLLNFDGVLGNLTPNDLYPATIYGLPVIRSPTFKRSTPPRACGAHC